MKRLILLAAALLLTGCSAVTQIEGQAFAVSLAVDEAEDGGVVLSVRFPSYGAQEGEAEGGGYLLTSAAGRDFASALYALNAAIPRALNLTQVKSLIVSEKLASSAAFPALLRDLKLSRLDGEASLIVSRGEANALLEAQQPLIGLRLSDTLVTEMERYRRLGCIPRSTLAEVFYDAESVYSDPVAILAAVVPKESGASGGQDVEKALAGDFMYDGENKDAYFGAALFRGGVMVGALTGGETQLLQLARAGSGQMPMALDGAWLAVTRQGLPRVDVDMSGDALRIAVSLTAGIEDLRGDADLEAVRQELTAGLEALTRRCQALGVEPFGYARWAAAQFLTLPQWTAFDWRARFPEAEVTYHLTVKKTNE